MESASKNEGSLASELAEYVKEIQRERLLRRSEGVGSGYERHIFRVFPMAILHGIVSVWVFFTSLLCGRLNGPWSRWIGYRVPYTLLLPWADHILFRFNVGWRGCAAGVISWIVCNWSPVEYVGPLCILIPLLSVGIPSSSVGLAMEKCLGILTAALWATLTSFVATVVLVTIPDLTARNITAGVFIVVFTFVYLLLIDSPGLQALFMVINSLNIVLAVLEPEGDTIFVPFYGLYAVLLACLLGLILTVLPVPIMAYGAVIRNVERNLRMTAEVFSLVARSIAVAPSNPQLARTILTRADAVLSELKEGLNLYKEDLVFAAKEVWFCELKGFDTYLLYQQTMVSLLDLLILEYRAVQWGSETMKLVSGYLGEPTIELGEALEDMVEPMAETLVRGLHFTPYPFYARDRSDDRRLHNEAVETLFHRRKADSTHADVPDGEEGGLTLATLIEALDLESSFPQGSSPSDADFWKLLMEHANDDVSPIYRSYGSSGVLDRGMYRRAVQSAVSLGAKQPTLEALHVPTTDPATPPPSDLINACARLVEQDGHRLHRKHRQRQFPTQFRGEDDQHVVYLDEGEKEQEKKGEDEEVGLPRGWSSSSTASFSSSIQEEDPKKKKEKEKEKEKEKLKKKREKETSPLMEALLRYETAYLQLRRDRFAWRPELPWIQETHLSVLTMLFLIFYFVRIYAGLSSLYDPTPSFFEWRSVVRRMPVGGMLRRVLGQVVPDRAMQSGKYGGGGSDRLRLGASLSLDRMFQFLLPAAAWAEAWVVVPLVETMPRFLWRSLTTRSGFRDFVLFRWFRGKYPLSKVLGSAQVTFALLLSCLTVFVPTFQRFFDEGLWAVFIVALYMARDSEARTFGVLSRVIVGTLFGTVVAYFSLLFLGDDLIPLGAIVGGVCFVCSFVMSDPNSSQVPVADAALGTFLITVFKGTEVDLSSTETLKAIALTRFEAVTVGLIIVVVVTLLRPQFVRLALRAQVLADLGRLEAQLHALVEHSAMATAPEQVRRTELHLVAQIVRGEADIRAGIARSRAILAEVGSEPLILRAKFPGATFGRILDANAAMLRALVLLSRAVRVGIFLQPKIMRVLADLLLQYESLVAARFAILRRLLNSPHSGVLAEKHDSLCSDSDFAALHQRMKRLVVIMFARFHIDSPIWMRSSVAVDIAALHALLEGETMFSKAVSDCTNATMDFLVQIMDA